MARTYNILIVDDEQSVVFLLKEELSEMEKYNVTIAYDGAEAINILQSQPFDVVLLDVKMPRVSGIEVLKYIREQHPTTIVLMLTNFADVKTAIETMKLGAYDFVSKPYEREELLATIDRALELRRLTIDNKLMEYSSTVRAWPVSLSGKVLRYNSSSTRRKKSPIVRQSFKFRVRAVPAKS